MSWITKRIPKCTCGVEFDTRSAILSPNSWDVSFLSSSAMDRLHKSSSALALTFQKVVKTREHTNPYLGGECLVLYPSEHHLRREGLTCIISAGASASCLGYMLPVAQEVISIPPSRSQIAYSESSPGVSGLHMLALRLQAASVALPSSTATTNPPLMFTKAAPTFALCPESTLPLASSAHTPNHLCRRLASSSPSLLQVLCSCS